MSEITSAEVDGSVEDGFLGVSVHAGFGNDILDSCALNFVEFFKNELAIWKRVSDAGEIHCEIVCTGFFGCELVGGGEV